MILVENLGDKYHRWEETIGQTAGAELSQMDETWRAAIRHRVGVSGVVSSSYIQRIGEKFYQDLETSLQHASVADRILPDKLIEAQETVAGTDPLLGQAVLSTGNLLLRIQDEPRLSDMPQEFKRVFITGRAKQVTKEFMPPLRPRQ